MLILAAGAALAAAGAPAAAPSSQVRELKRLQQQMLVAARVERLDAQRARARPLSRAARRQTQRPPRELGEPGLARALAGAARVDDPLLPTDAPPNVPVNDASGDLASFSAQSEVAIARHGRRLVAAWNDGEGQRAGLDPVGWGWSADGGATWTDGGVLPHGTTVASWTSDPVIAVDERTGRFALASLVITAAGNNGIALVHGTFGDSGPEWQGPVLARAVRDTLPDKPWIAADSSSGNLYLVYTTFFRAGQVPTDEIEFQRSADGGNTWSAPLVLSSPGDRGLVHGARAAAGPDGEVWAAWTAVDTSLGGDGVDYLRVARSDDRGGGFGPERTAVRFFSNFGSGAPGFNRGYGFSWPSLAVDRSRGRHRGRVHLAWNEAVDFYDDPLGTLGTTPEAEPNESPATASAFVVGDTLMGEVTGSSDIDHFSFFGSAGQTAVFYVDSVSGELDLSVRVLCSDGTTRLAYNAPIAVRHRLLIFTLPSSGPFLLRLAPNDARPGTYRVRTGFHVPPGDGRARDHRDVFTCWSDDGVAWSEPARVNDGPGWFDDWLPEIAISGDGTAWVAWYDWHDAPPSTCGGVAHVYLARSEDGGGTWSPVGPMTDAQTAWSHVLSNISPNQGDYIALSADHRSVTAAWADGRNGDPDVFAAVRPAPGRVTLERADTHGSQVSLEWYAPSSAGVTATLERKEADGGWTALAGVASDAHGAIAWEDTTVIPGLRYGYRLALEDEEDGLRRAGEAWVQVAAAAPPALLLDRVRPHPARTDVFVEFVLPSAAPATLEVLDLAGRRLRVVDVGSRGPGRHVVNLGAGPALRPGVYLARITQQGRSRSLRFAVVR